MRVIADDDRVGGWYLLTCTRVCCVAGGGVQRHQLDPQRAVVNPGYLEGSQVCGAMLCMQQRA